MQLRENEVLDDLLIDDLKIIQNTALYRFTSDSVLLSKFAKAKANDVVADFCSGSGIVGLHFYALHPQIVKSVTFFELQQELYEMSLRTVEYNHLQDKISAVNTRIQDISNDYCGKFSLILCNPPYEKGGFDNADEKKAICRKELFLSLEELCFAFGRFVKFGGRVAFCHRADRVAEIICELSKNNLQVKRMQFVSGREGDKPYLVLIEAVKGGKAGVDVLPMSVNTPQNQTKKQEEESL